jgi:hypothetical protein
MNFFLLIILTLEIFCKRKNEKMNDMGELLNSLIEAEFNNMEAQFDQEFDALMNGAFDNAPQSVHKFSIKKIVPTTTIIVTKKNLKRGTGAPRINPLDVFAQFDNMFESILEDITSQFVEDILQYELNHDNEIDLNNHHDHHNEVIGINDVSDENESQKKKAKKKKKTENKSKIQKSDKTESNLNDNTAKPENSVEKDESDKSEIKQDVKHDKIAKSNEEK